jgi:hypothetical protein
VRTTLTSAHSERPVAMMCNCKQRENDSDVSPFEQARRTGNKETVAFEGAQSFVIFGWEVFMVGGPWLVWRRYKGIYIEVWVLGF